MREIRTSAEVKRTSAQMWQHIKNLEICRLNSNAAINDQIHPQKWNLHPLPQQVVAMFSNIFGICPCACHSDELLNILGTASWAADLINIRSTKGRYSFFFPRSSVNYIGRINRAFIIIVISCLPVSKTSLISCTSCQPWQETLNPQTRGTRGRLSAHASAPPPLMPLSVPVQTACVNAAARTLFAKFA